MELFNVQLYMLFFLDDSMDTDPVMYWRQLNGLDVEHMYNQVFDLIVSIVLLTNSLFKCNY